MIEGLRTASSFRRQYGRPQHGPAKVPTDLDVADPCPDAAYVLLWIPGLVPACFDWPWIVGPVTLAVVPLTRPKPARTSLPGAPAGPGGR